MNTWRLSEAIRSFRDQFQQFDSGSKGGKRNVCLNNDNSGSSHYRQLCIDPSEILL